MLNIGDSQNKTVAVVTGTRAEFGLLRPVIDELTKAMMSVRLLVTGTHLADAFGKTISEIKAGGYSVEKEFDILFNDAETPMDKAFARAFSLFFEYFSSNPPDIVVLLGDRYETLAAALAAGMSNLPVAHIGGGDVTEGAKDDCFRHCVTKLSRLHFPSTERCRRRIIQLGEAPERVFNVGSLGAENMTKLPVMSKRELSHCLGFDFDRDYLLVTYHPETLGGVHPLKGLNEMLFALDAVGLSVLFTKANADDEGAAINRRLAEYCEGRDGCRLFDSLGAERYMSALRYAKAVVGNSSSAVVEAPVLRVPAVDIGGRQKGRETGVNVINCKEDRVSIERAVRKAVSDEFRESIKDMQSPYGGVDVSKNIASEIFEFLQNDSGGLRKQFYDVCFKTDGE